MNQSDSDLSSSMDNHLEHTEPSLTTPDVPANDGVETTPPRDVVESETTKAGKNIFVTTCSSLGASYFEKL